MENTQYTYNALGERIKKINQNGLTTNFHYGFNGDLLFEKDQTGDTKEYVWLNGQPLARIDNGTVIYYYHVDHLGTPQVMTDAAGAIKWRADYEPFGKATIKVSAVENNLRLPGQYFDRETGLHYNYFRDYDPTTGRYVQVDPIGLEGGMNLYAYVDGNPVSRVDPSGNSWVAPAIGAGVAIGTVWLAKSCMERCTGTKLPRTPNTCTTPSPERFSQCANYCVTLAGLLNFAGDPIGGASSTVGEQVGKAVGGK